MMRPAVWIAGLFLLLPILILPGSGTRPQVEWRGTSIPMAAQGAIVVAEASCASLCRQRHNQCRISTRGAPRCDADLQRCLKGCLATKRQ